MLIYFLQSRTGRDTSSEKSVSSSRGGSSTSLGPSTDTLKRNTVSSAAVEPRQQSQTLDELVQRRKKSSTSSHEQFPLDKPPPPAINELLEVYLYKLTC